MKEVWKPAIDFEGIYEVSSLGRVKSLEREVKNSRGSGYKIWKEKMLAIRLNNARKYINVKLRKNKKTHSIQVHRLVMESFNGRSNLEVNHKNLNKHDNRLTNLEWCTRKENIKHAIDFGATKFRKGSEMSHSKINEDTVRTIKELRMAGSAYKDIAKKLHVTTKIVGDVCRGRTWGHV